MPHKRNPVAAICALGCAQQAPGLAATLLGAMAHEHERAAGAWHAEWRPLGELLRSTGSAVAWLRDSLEGLEADPERMRANLDLTGGRLMAERVAAALTAGERSEGGRDAHAALEAATQAEDFAAAVADLRRRGARRGAARSHGLPRVGGHVRRPRPGRPRPGGLMADDGERVRREVLGDEHVDRTLGSASDYGAPFQDYLTRVAWGEVWARPGLDRRARSCLTLALLTALRAENEIPMHVRAAIRHGVTPEEIREVVIHAALYAGIPAGNAAFRLVEQTLREDGEL